MQLSGQVGRAGAKRARSRDARHVLAKTAIVTQKKKQKKKQKKEKKKKKKQKKKKKKKKKKKQKKKQASNQPVVTHQ